MCIWLWKPFLFESFQAGEGSRADFCSPNVFKLIIPSFVPPPPSSEPRQQQVKTVNHTDYLKFLLNLLGVWLTTKQEALISQWNQEYLWVPFNTVVNPFQRPLTSLKLGNKEIFSFKLWFAEGCCLLWSGINTFTLCNTTESLKCGGNHHKGTNNRQH